MDGTLTFCKDSILRFQHSVDTHNVPLVLMHQALGISSERLILRMLRNPCLIEEGCTLGALLIALEPWKEVFHDLTGIDVGAYIQEARLPSDEHSLFDFIEIRRSVLIGRDIKRVGPRGDSIRAILNAKYERLKTLSIDNTIDIFGRCDGEPGNYGMTDCTLAKIRNVPLVLNQRPLILESLDTENDSNNVLNGAADGVEDCTNYRYLDCTSKAEFDLKDIAVTVIKTGLFFYSPVDRDIGNAQILESIRELDAMRAGPIPDNVTPINPEAPIQAGPKDPTVVIHPNAFDDVFRGLADDFEAWRAFMKRIPKDLRYPIIKKKLVFPEGTNERILGSFTAKPDDTPK